MREYASDRVDLRSDTVTQPTQSMRELMASAKVGDDVMGDDPTVNALQDKVAKLLGKEAGLFVSSGTMGNAVAILAHTRPGDEIVAYTKSHIFRYEGGGYASLAGCSMSLVPAADGIMKPEDVKAAIRKAEGSESHYPDCSLVCVENTSNLGGGSVYPQEILDEICQVAHDNGCKAHMDGARLFNAVAVSGTDPARMVRDFDPVTICLSKGLGAPVGSVLVGSKGFIDRAHRFRKMLGGGMRQAGIIAAGGLYALENNMERLAEDHIRAKRLAVAINEMSNYSVELDAVHSNIVLISTPEGAAKSVVSSLAEQGVDIIDIHDSQVRAVTHLHITDEDIERTIAAFSSTQ